MKIYALVGSTDPNCGGGGNEILILSTDKKLIEKYEKIYNETIDKAIYGKGPWPDKSLDNIDTEEYETDVIPEWLLKLDADKET